MKKLFIVLICIVFLLCLKINTIHAQVQKIRPLADTVGFAQYGWQMDSIMNRIQRIQGDKLQQAFESSAVTEETLWKVAICPHDDYTYAGYMYPLSLFNVQAKTLILIGVCHKAKQFGLENKIIFDSFTSWKGPYGKVKISPLRDEIYKNMPAGIAIVHDSVQLAEHSLEALIPLLQYYNHDIEIIPILIPYMPAPKMDIFSQMLAQSIKLVTTMHNMSWGADFAMVLSTDAVHYGDQDWGDKKYDWYGVDKVGYTQALAHEREIIDRTIKGDIKMEKLRQFCNYTVDEKNYKEYKWTWCGRYSVPFGLWTAYYMQRLLGVKLNGTLLDYSTSIEQKPLPVDDLKMGHTAPANLHHWVGYVSVGYQ